MTVDASNSSNFSNALCTKSHEYLLIEGKYIKIGVTDFAVEQLGDVVFVELPEVDSEFKKGEVFGTIESVKAASELYMPISGKIAEINDNAVENPELINTSPFENGWLIKIVDYKESELGEAMSYKDYKAFIDEEN